MLSAKVHWLNPLEKYSKDFAKLRITKLEPVQLWPTALAVLDQMKHDGIQPDGFCYSSAINCCGADVERYVPKLQHRTPTSQIHGS
jgi:hypothetical protein